MFIKLVVTVIPPKYFKMQVKYKYMKYHIFEPVSIKDRPRTGDCGLGTADWGLRTADCGLRTADCGLRTADCGLRTADCGLRTADCGLRTPNYGLGIKHGLGKKRGLSIKCGLSLKIAVLTHKSQKMLLFQIFVLLEKG